MYIQTLCAGSVCGSTYTCGSSYRQCVGDSGLYMMTREMLKERKEARQQTRQGKATQHMGQWKKKLYVLIL